MSRESSGPSPCRRVVDCQSPESSFQVVVSSIGLSQVLAVLICSAAKGVAMDYQDGH